MAGTGAGEERGGAVRALRLETKTCKAQGGQMRLGRHVGKGRVMQTTEATGEKETVFPSGRQDAGKEVPGSPRSCPLVSPAPSTVCRQGDRVTERPPAHRGVPGELRLLESGSSPSYRPEGAEKEARGPRSGISKLSRFIARKASLVGEKV